MTLQHGCGRWYPPFKCKRCPFFASPSSYGICRCLFLREGSVLSKWRWLLAVLGKVLWLERRKEGWGHVFALTLLIISKWVSPAKPPNPIQGHQMQHSELQHWLGQSCSSDLSTSSIHKLISGALCLWYLKKNQKRIVQYTKQTQGSSGTISCWDDSSLWRRKPRGGTGASLSCGQLWRCWWGQKLLNSFPRVMGKFCSWGGTCMHWYYYDSSLDTKMRQTPKHWALEVA